MDCAPHRGYSTRQDVFSQCNQGLGKAGTAISCQQLLRQNLDCFLQTSATRHAQVVASITAARVPPLILHVFLVQTWFVH